MPSQAPSSFPSLQPSASPSSPGPSPIPSDAPSAVPTVSLTRQPVLDADPDSKPPSLVKIYDTERRDLQQGNLRRGGFVN
jgi:hypothetical protein